MPCLTYDNIYKHKYVKINKNKKNNGRFKFKNIFSKLFFDKYKKKPSIDGLDHYIFSNTLLEG
jgi:hypothetical protein